MENNNTITIETIVNAPVEKVWDCWTDPVKIKQWNNASDDWHTPYAENDLRPGGFFLSRMAAKDGSFQFDFQGVYDDVQLYKSISYTIADGRKVRVDFIPLDSQTKISERFEPESTNSLEMQRNGWLAILNNFKKFAESE